MNNVKTVADMIGECKNVAFFGGAGVSTESGVKDYRSENGLYSTVKEYGIPPEEILSRDFFFEKPDVFYDFYRKYFISDAKPNGAHKALEALEERGILSGVITQNIDGLHQAAGSKNVIELHGNAKKFYCSKCKTDADGFAATEAIKKGGIPKCPHCSGIVKPKVVLYGEPLYDGVAEAAVDIISHSEMLIVGGTSLAVYPAASFVRYFCGKYLIIINKTETDYDKRADLIVRENIGEFFENVMKYASDGHIF